jgi:hypothetical protein
MPCLQLNASADFPIGEIAAIFNSAIRSDATGRSPLHHPTRTARARISPPNNAK